ncbi:type I methionyl aminopeptidase [Candidatus Giovannonibacteria bacterium]|nr:type I methionyl aminopeptidase [Candidatus Giovannonibacteria bacterium]
MIIRNSEEREILREGGRKLAAVLAMLKKEIKAGVTSAAIDQLALELILETGGEPSFKGYKVYGARNPYPGTVCISINDEVVHGIPSGRELANGDIVGLDIGMKYRGLFTDMAETVSVGKIDAVSEKLIDVTKNSLERAIAILKAGATTGDVGFAIEKYVTENNFGIIRELVGHGVGRAVHEDPEIPNWGKAGEGNVFREDEVIAIEPMTTEGSEEVYLAKDGWTWKTKDGKRSAHFEHTIIIGKNFGEVITKI